MITELTNLLTALAGGLFLLVVGVAWSRTAWSHGAFGFDLGYLVVAVLVSRILTAKMAGSPFGRKEWFLMVLPAGPCWVFEALADHSLSNLKEDITKHKLGTFAIFSCLMLVSLLVWVVLFPEGNFSEPSPRNDQVVWRKIISTTAALLGITLVSGTIWLLLRTNGTPSNTFRELQSLESWLYKWSLLVYLFLTLRTVFPIWEARLQRTIRGTE